MVEFSPLPLRKKETWMSFSKREIEAARQLVKLCKYKNNVLRKKKREREEDEDGCFKTKKTRFRSIESLYKLTKPVVVEGEAKR